MSLELTHKFCRGANNVMTYIQLFKALLYALVD